MKSYLIPIGAGALVIAGAVYFAVDRVTESLPMTGRNPEDPCYGKSDDECMKLIEDARAESDRKYTQLIEEANSSELDLRSLPQTPLQLDYFTQAYTDLATAVREAELIVMARSEDVRLVPFTSAEVTLGIERVLKGTTGSEMTITQAAFLQADGDNSGEWRPGSLGVDEVAPLLFPGDRAVLFLRSFDGVGYAVQIFTGHYLIDEEGRLSSLPSNPFAAEVNGKTVEEFVTSMMQGLAQPVTQ